MAVRAVEGQLGSCERNVHNMQSVASTMSDGRSLLEFWKTSSTLQGADKHAGGTSTSFGLRCFQLLENRL